MLKRTIAIGLLFSGLTSVFADDFNYQFQVQNQKTDSKNIISIIEKEFRVDAIYNEELNQFFLFSNEALNSDKFHQYLVKKGYPIVAKVHRLNTTLSKEEYSQSMNFVLGDDRQENYQARKRDWIKANPKTYADEFNGGKTQSID